MTKKLSNKKGFTLAELLIVVAIIGILTAISVPIFTSQLKKSKLSTNQANARAAHSAVVSALLDSNKNDGSGTYVVKEGKATIDATTATDTSITKDPAEWNVTDNSDLATDVMPKWVVKIDTTGAVSYKAVR